MATPALRVAAVVVTHNRLALLRRCLCCVAGWRAACAPGAALGIWVIDNQSAGGTGGRLSHTIANLQMMAGLATRGIRAELVGCGTRIWVIRNGEIRFPAEARGYLSVFCLGDAAEGVTEEGLKYQLDGYRMVKENPLGVSNEFTGIPSRVAVQEGTLLIIQEERTC